MKVDEYILLENELSDLIKLRRTIHANPELSGEEYKTADQIAAYLSQFEADEIIRNIGGAGLAAIYKFQNDGPTILVRCELDALPIQEINTFDYKSVVNGKSHKCGHDGHMTMVAGIANMLKTRPWRKGRVVLLFQPAEENGAGAEKVLKDEKFSLIKPDYVVALHNLPGIKTNAIVCRNNSFTASVKSMIIKLKGITSHAGEPEMGINPALAISQIISEGLDLQHPPESENFSVVTPIQIEMGEEAFGISAGYGELKFTLRSWTNAVMEKLCSDMEMIAQKIGESHGLQVEIDWTQYFAANQNDEMMVEVIKESAVGNNFEYINNNHAFKWGEDFGLFTEKFKGAMFGLGSGVDLPALHNPDYDFPDEIIPAGIKMFTSIINHFLGEDE